jgi:spermidine/putrescine-binding protein
VEFYNTKIAQAKNVEVVHMNLDQNEAAMKQWILNNKLSYPVVVPEKARKIKLLEPLSPKGVPNYKLVDSDGNMIAEGEEAKHKAEELAAGKTKE